MPLMASPAELGGLRPFADKAVDRPGVDEFTWSFRDGRDLGVAFGDVDCLDPDPLGELCPFDAARRARGSVLQAACEVYQRLLDEMRDEAGVGAVRHDCRRPVEVMRAQSQSALA